MGADEEKTLRGGAGDADVDLDVVDRRYRQLSELGSGAMGRVYRAHDAALGRAVAIKVMDPEALDAGMARERFVREARAAARLRHPNIVSVYDVDEHAGYLVMELVEGRSLAELAAEAPTSAELARRIAGQVLSGLEAAHEAGIVHRDIKPSNIMIDGRGRAILVDFGVARLDELELTRTGHRVGTPAFMAPEQLRGEKVDRRADLYALGATLFRALTGEYHDPFSSSRRSVFAAVHGACGDRALANFVAVCLEPRPEDRFESAAEARVALGGRDLRPRWIMMTALAAAVLVAGVLVPALGGGGAPAQRLERAWKLAQRGEHEQARDLVTSYLHDHPGDPDAITLEVLVAWWTGAAEFSRETVESAIAGGKLAPAQAALLRGLLMINVGREAEAVQYLERARKEHPRAPEVWYGLGEARWHANDLAGGVKALRRAFELDPGWGVALEHVEQFELSRGAPERLRPLLDPLRGVDPAAAAALRGAILLEEQRYEEAERRLEEAAAREDDVALLWLRLAEARALAGDHEGYERAARRAFELSPVDTRDFGALTHLAESFLYRGETERFDELLASTNRVRALFEVLRRGGTLEREAFVPGPLSGPGLHSSPFWIAVYLLLSAEDGAAIEPFLEPFSEPEVAALGRGLLARRRGESPAEMAAYERALEVPSRGDIRMLLAYLLARARAEGGDLEGAAAACGEVFRPRRYLPYRAVLLPDCRSWAEGAE